MSRPVRGLVPASSLTLDELVLLTEELQALVRAGVPLDIGLHSSAGRMPRRLRRITQGLSEALAAGATLPQALETLGETVPPPFRTLVEVGARTGRLDELLTELARFGGLVRDMQKQLSAAIIEPLALLVVGYLLSLLFIDSLFPRFADFYGDLQTAPPVWIRTGMILRESLPYWGPGLPVLFILFLVIRRFALPPSWQPVPDFGGVARFVPGMARAVREAEAARFGQLLAMLIEAQVPLTEALPVVSHAVSDPGLRRWCRDAADATRSGQLDRVPPARALPALLRWLLVQRVPPESLAYALRQMADLHRERALARMRRLVHFWPAAMTIGIGLTFVGLMATSTFGTLLDLWSRIPG
jgi:type II secretory pathway component PulF